MGTIGPASGPARTISTVTLKKQNNNIMGGSGLSKLEKFQSGNVGGGGGTGGGGGGSVGGGGAGASSPFAQLQGPAAAMATHLHNFSTNFGSASKQTPPSSPQLQPSAEQRNQSRSPEDETESQKTVKSEVVNGLNNLKNNGQLSPSLNKRSVIPPKPPPKPNFIKKPHFVLQGSRTGFQLSNHSLSPKVMKKVAKNGSVTPRKCRHLLLDANCALRVDDLWCNKQFLTRFFKYFSVSERVILAQVCAHWKSLLYQPCYWHDCLPVLRCKSIRLNDRLKFFESLQQRGLDSVCIFGANDDDVNDMMSSCSTVAKCMRQVTLKCCSVSDKGLENLLDGMTGVYKLELSGCNEVSEAGLWSALDSRILSLTISDCINVADESLGAVAQLLPSLCEFNLQAYHVTDVALSYFSQKQSSSLNILRLQSCWEISNQGVSNMVHALPNLTILSLAGCTKLTDAGVEVIAENLKKLRCLDLSWCSRITDAALEYIACDLTQLEQLTLDRCVHITDIGVGYISTMLALQILFLRWCSQMGDFGLQHLCGMRNLQILSVAGCSLLTVGGLSALVQLRNLRELELTNCPGASSELFEYLRQQLPRCLIVK